jgi:hypothetical protein
VPTFLSVFNLADGGATKTATAKSTGAADANKTVMAAIIGNGTAVPTSVTFTPDTGSPVVVTTASLSRPASGPDVMFYQALMPTGTTTDISVLFPSNPFTNYEMAIWSVDSSLLNSTTAASASAVRAGPAISTNLNVQAGGFILAVAFMNAFSGNSGSIACTSPDSFASRQSASANAGWNIVADASGTAAKASSTITATFGLNTAALAFFDVTPERKVGN